MNNVSSLGVLDLGRPIGGGSENIINWFVDSVNGSDSNTGKTAAQAFQTIGKLLTQTIPNNQVSGLARGSHWREQLTLPASTGLIVKAYGSGAQPVLDASDIISSWTNLGGATPNVWASTSTVPLAWAAGKTTVNAWEDGTFLVRAASLAACNTTAGTFFPSDEQSSPITINIHTSNGSNPNSNGKTYEYSNRQFGFESITNTSTSCHLINVTTKNNSHNDGSTRLAQKSTATNCNFLNGNVHSILFEHGCTLSGCTALYGFSWGLNGNSGWNPYVCYDFASSGNNGLNTYMNNCAATQTSNQNATYTDEAIYGHSAGVTGNAIYINNFTATNMGLIGGMDAQSHVYWTNITGVNTTSGTDSGIIVTTDCTIDGLFGTGYQNRLVDITQQSGKSVEIKNVNVTMNNTNNSNPIFIQQPNITLNIHDSTWNGLQTYFIVNLNQSGCNFTIQRNTWGTPVNLGADDFYYLGSQAITLNSDFNTFPSTNLHFLVAGTNYTSLGAYKTGTGQDSHSTP